MFDVQCIPSLRKFICLLNRKFYEISNTFPENCLLVRSASERKRTIYFVSTGLATMLKNVDQTEFNVR